MIIGILLNIISILLAIVAAILPDWSLPAEFFTPLTESLGMLGLFNSFLPLGACFTVFSAMILFELTYYLYRLYFGMVSLVRGGGDIKT